MVNLTYPVNITVLAPPTQGNITYSANLTHPYNESDLASIDVPLTETVVVGGPSASATATVVLHIGNSTSDSGSGASLQPAIPALGAVLGAVIVISVILVGLLLRKNKQLFRAAKEARESALSDPSESNYPLASKELDVISQDDSPAQLKRQLAQVRQELAAVTVLTPSTIRDQSDYVRDLTLLNDNIRQLSMRINRDRPDLPAAVLRAKICAALWSAVFARFDAGLDGNTEQHMSNIMNQFQKPSTALLWKAMTVQNLPLANPASVAPKVEQNLAASIGGGVQPGQTVEVVRQSLALSRAVTEDGKGFSVSYAQDGQAFGLMSGSTSVPI
ncbi:hypothetical protein EHS25_006083 [Saitozyma podzolica]|uniref:Uncharacterized protein n=1 Tax=Saitozyma podzolica TaxID=1890683 RepID=A0A427XTI7_9TREE|nr:hypothetical protein EHS25_006083 [Saitozyma podzolica]